jgi:hypothetical protein
VVFIKFWHPPSKPLFKSIGSPLLNLTDNVDDHLISIIQKEVQPGSKILEISCGNAADSLKLQGLGYEVSCTEYNTDYVKNAQDLGLNCIQHDHIRNDLTKHL